MLLSSPLRLPEKLLALLTPLYIYIPPPGSCWGSWVSLNPFVSACVHCLLLGLFGASLVLPASSCKLGLTLL